MKSFSLSLSASIGCMILFATLWVVVLMVKHLKERNSNLKLSDSFHILQNLMERSPQNWAFIDFQSQFSMSKLSWRHVL